VRDRVVKVNVLGDTIQESTAKSQSDPAIERNKKRDIGFWLPEVLTTEQPLVVA
jgi:hypothetical protein